MPFQMKYPPKSAYTFSSGPFHESQCMDPYFRSPEYQAIKERRMRAAGILQRDVEREIEHEENPDLESED